MCANVGVDPLASNKGVWAQVPLPYYWKAYADNIHHAMPKSCVTCIARPSIRGTLSSDSGRTGSNADNPGAGAGLWGLLL